jgi:hypothetical protein
MTGEEPGEAALRGSGQQRQRHRGPPQAEAEGHEVGEAIGQRPCAIDPAEHEDADDERAGTRQGQRTEEQAIDVGRGEPITQDGGVAEEERFELLVHCDCQDGAGGDQVRAASASAAWMWVPSSNPVDSFPVLPLEVTSKSGVDGGFSAELPYDGLHGRQNLGGHDREANVVEELILGVGRNLRGRTGRSRRWARRTPTRHRRPWPPFARW